MIRLCYATTPETARQSHSCEHDISRTPWGNFFKFATNAHVDWQMKWLVFCCQRLSSPWPYKTHYWSCRHNISGRPWESPFKFHTNVQLESWMNWLDLGGWRSKVKVTVASQNGVLVSWTWKSSLSLGNFFRLDQLSLWLKAFLGSKVRVTSYESGKKYM